MFHVEQSRLNRRSRAPNAQWLVATGFVAAQADLPSRAVALMRLSTTQSFRGRIPRRKRKSKIAHPLETGA